MPKRKTLLITGGCGFIGSNLIRYLLSMPKLRTNDVPFYIINFDKLTYSGNPDNLKMVLKNKRTAKHYTFVKGDISNQKKIESVFKKYRPDYLINLAAETHVDRSIHVGAKEFIDTNVNGVFVLLEAIKKFGVERAIFVSTDEVYGTLSLNAKGKFTEKSQYAPNVPYSATKAGGDLLCNAYYFTWKLPLIVTHCSNNYGPFQYPEKLIPYFTLLALENRSLPLYGDGKNVRDWIYVLDHCRALETVLLKGKPGEIYNIGADNELSNLVLVKKMLKILGKPQSLITFVHDRPGHDRRYAIDASKIQKELGWRPRFSFYKMLEETIRWYQENSAWVGRIRKKTGVFNPHIDLWKKA